MPRPTRSTLAPLAATGLGVLLLAGPGAAPAAAAKKHAPCPKAGTTLTTSGSPNVRVWRAGTALRACTRAPGQRRYVRTLGTWSPSTKVYASARNVAWTTERTSPAGPVDAVRTVDVRTGASWLSTVHAALAPDAATPASDDRVLRLITDDTATTWVTARGIVAVAVRKIDAEQPGTLYGEGLTGTTPYRVGRRFFLGNAGPANAPAVAAGLALEQSSEGDECGGTTDYRVSIPAWDARPATVFAYKSQGYVSPYDYCR